MKLTRLGLLILVVTLAGIGVACDDLEQPLRLRNDLDMPVMIEVFDAEGPHMPVATKADPTIRDTVSLSEGQESRILFDAIDGLRDYTIVVKSNSGEELLRRTITQEQLAELEWQLVITETGIE